MGKRKIIFIQHRTSAHTPGFMDSGTKSVGEGLSAEPGTTMKSLSRGERMWAKTHRWNGKISAVGKSWVDINRRGKANFGALKQNPICKQSRGVVCLDKIKWNILSDATKKEPRARAMD